MAWRKVVHLLEVIYGLRVSPKGSCAGRVVLSIIFGRWNLLGGAVCENFWPTGVLQTFQREVRAHLLLTFFAKMLWAHLISPPLPPATCQGGERVARTSSVLFGILAFGTVS